MADDKTARVVSSPTKAGHGIRVQESPGGVFIQAFNGEGDAEKSIFVGDDEALSLISALAEEVDA